MTGVMLEDANKAHKPLPPLSVCVNQSNVQKPSGGNNWAEFTDNVYCEIIIKYI